MCMGACIHFRPCSRVDQQPLPRRIHNDAARRPWQTRQEATRRRHRCLRREVTAVLRAAHRRSFDAEILHSEPLGTTAPADAPVQPTPREAREEAQEEEPRRGRCPSHHLLLPQVVGRRRRGRVVVRRSKNTKMQQTVSALSLWVHGVWCARMGAQGGASSSAS
jgi:hypothetical protein